MPRGRTPQHQGYTWADLLAPAVDPAGMATTGTDIVGGPPVHTTGGDLLHHGRATDIDLGPGATPHVSIEGLPGSVTVSGQYYPSPFILILQPIFSPSLKAYFRLFRKLN